MAKWLSVHLLCLHKLVGGHGFDSRQSFSFFIDFPPYKVGNITAGVVIIIVNHEICTLNSVIIV